MPKCKACPAEITWAKTGGGKNIPLQALRTIYLLQNGVAQKSALTGVYVSHFETCPKASSFSKPKEKR